MTRFATTTEDQETMAWESRARKCSFYPIFVDKKYSKNQSTNDLRIHSSANFTSSK